MTLSNTPYIEATDLQRAAEVIGRAFQSNAINLHTTKHQSLESNIADFHTRLVQLKSEAGAYIIQPADDSYSSIAVWIPPEYNTPAFPEPLIPEFREAEDWYAKLSKAHLKGRPHWHLTMLAKDPLAESVKGSTSKLVKPILEKAKEQKVPAMLECIDERAKLIYEHYGFENVETFIIGHGHCDSDGTPLEGGQGLHAWYMLYNS